MADEVTKPVELLMMWLAADNQWRCFVGFDKGHAETVLTGVAPTDAARAAELAFAVASRHAGKNLPESWTRDGPSWWLADLRGRS